MRYNSLEAIFQSDYGYFSLNNKQCQYNEETNNDNDYYKNNSFNEDFKFNIQDSQKDESWSFMDSRYNLFLNEQTTTKFGTSKNNNILSFKQELNIEENNNNEKSNYNFTFYKDIKKFLKKNKKFAEICEKFKKNENIVDAEKKFCNKKRQIDINYENNENNESFVLIENKEKDEKNVKRGRKIKKEKQNKYKVKHNKYSGDNIIRKIKAQLLLYLLTFLNNILNTNNNNDKNKLYKLDSKYIYQLKKEIDLNLLKMKIKDLYSLNISPIYKYLSKDFNKNLIQKIIEKEIVVEDYPTIAFVFNLSFEEWIKLFTYKKSICEIIKDDKEFEDVNIKKIEKGLVGVEDLLKNILVKNKEYYFSSFTYFLYNYERYFNIKTGRNKKNKILFKLKK